MLECSSLKVHKLAQKWKESWNILFNILIIHGDALDWPEQRFSTFQNATEGQPAEMFYLIFPMDKSYPEM